MCEWDQLRLFFPEEGIGVILVERVSGVSTKVTGVLREPIRLAG